jgi:hypothetical protein
VRLSGHIFRDRRLTKISKDSSDITGLLAIALPVRFDAAGDLANGDKHPAAPDDRADEGEP